LKKFLFLIIPVFIYADSLKSLLEFATQNNDLVASKEFVQKAKAKEVKSKENSFYPTIDVGAFYQTENKRVVTIAGDIYSAYAKVSYDIYDGGKKSHQLAKTKNEYKSTNFNLESTKKSLMLQIVEEFFNIKSLQATLDSKQTAKDSLGEQLTRVKRFYKAKITTKDNVDRLQSAYDTNIYEIQSLNFQIDSLISALELKVGKEIKTFDNSKFKNFKSCKLELNDDIKAIKAKKDALLNDFKSIGSLYYPQLKIEDSFSFYGYGRVDALHPKSVDKQNKLMLVLNMRLFDMGSIRDTKESIMISSQSLSSQMSYSKKAQTMAYKLALLRIKTAKVNIKSALSALTSAKRAFGTISKKYDAKIVDNVVYLDSLTNLTMATSLYEKSLNDLQIAYAKYYFYAGKNIEEFLQ